MTAESTSPQSGDYLGSPGIGPVSIPTKHAVQFYEDEDHLTRVVADFVGVGLASGNPALVIAVTARHPAIKRHLEARAFDVNRAVESGTLTFLDAEATLAMLMVDGEPRRELFALHIGGRIRQAREQHRERSLHAYGEMVDLLWKDGSSQAAIALEEIWNDLARSEDLSLLCGYALARFSASEDDAGFDLVCAAHSHVHPTGGFTSIATENGRNREIARLQQRARALEEELHRRELLEEELRQQRELLREREQALRDFIENGALGIHGVGPDGIILFANKAELEMLGYSRDEYEGRHVRDFHADEEAVDDILRRLHAGETVRDYEARLRCKDGTLRHVLIDANVYWRDGKFVHTRCFTRDVTEQRRSAIATCEQNRINETLLSIASSLNSELELDALVARLTEQATALCRAEHGAFFYNVVDDKGESYTLYTLAGADRSLFAELPMPRKTALFQPTFDGTEIVRADDVTKDPRFGKSPPHHGMPASHLPVKSYLAVPVKSRSGEVLGGLFFGHSEPDVFREADERMLAAVASHAAVAMDNAKLFQAARRAESIARAERQKLSELFMQSPALIVLLRGPDHVYEFVNAAARPLVGRGDAIGKPLREVLVQYPSERIAILDEVFRTGKRYVEDAVRSVRDWNSDGRPYERFFNMVYEPYRAPDGTVEGIMSFGFEVTEQIRVKQKLEAIALELECAGRTKDDFLATVSHELRTPLNAILGWARMLRSASLPPDKQDRALETIERNANAQTQLIEDLLDVSRIISGKLRLDVGDIDLPLLLDNAIEAVRPAAHAKGVTLRQVMDPDEGLMGTNRSPLVGDADRLQQVVWNLLTNAVKFTPKGGTVTIAVCKRDAAVEIVVADDGQGIAPEFLPNVFERFRQADSSTARKQGGLGLGLAIVRHLVELHGGTVKVESEGIGRGATFTVSLPVAPLRATSLQRPPPLRLLSTASFECPRELEGAHVLIVDDEPDVRELLAEMLAMCKARITSAASTSEALQLVQDLRPDVIVSDIGMPGEDGYALIQRLRALPQSRGGRTPAIALTAYARFEDRTKALVAGFNMHVPKPVEPSELIAVMTSLTRMFPRS